jgi:hypothetical protein
MYVAAFAFSLRVPSEGLCLNIAHHETDDCENGKWLIKRDDHTLMRWDGRKNKFYASRLEMRCWCSTSEITCPVHAIYSKPGPLFPIELKQATAMTILRRRLEETHIKNVRQYAFKSFRRGHAEMILNHGGNLGEILRAGAWTSRQSSSYIDQEKLQANTAKLAAVNERRSKRARHGDESSSESSSEDEPSEPDVGL